MSLATLPPEATPPQTRIPEPHLPGSTATGPSLPSDLGAPLPADHAAAAPPQCPPPKYENYVPNERDRAIYHAVRIAARTPEEVGREYGLKARTVQNIVLLVQRSHADRVAVLECNTTLDDLRLAAERLDHQWQAAQRAWDASLGERRSWRIVEKDGQQVKTLYGRQEFGDPRFLGQARRATTEQRLVKALLREEQAKREEEEGDEPREQGWGKNEPKIREILMDLLQMMNLHQSHMDDRGAAGAEADQLAQAADVAAIIARSQQTFESLWAALEQVPLPTPQRVQPSPSDPSEPSRTAFPGRSDGLESPSYGPATAAPADPPSAAPVAGQDVKLWHPNDAAPAEEAAGEAAEKAAGGKRPSLDPDWSKLVAPTRHRVPEEPPPRHSYNFRYIPGDEPAPPETKRPPTPREQPEQAVDQAHHA